MFPGRVPFAQAMKNLRVSLLPEVLGFVRANPLGALTRSPRGTLGNGTTVSTRGVSTAGVDSKTKDEKDASRFDSTRVGTKLPGQTLLLKPA